jgi:hypothetical protein
MKMRTFTVYHNYTGKRLGTVFAGGRHHAICVYSEMTGADLASLVAE